MTVNYKWVLLFFVLPQFGRQNLATTDSAIQIWQKSFRVLVQDVSEDVFELDLDWTPVGLDEAPPIKSCKTSRSHDSDIEEEVHKGVPFFCFSHVYLEFTG